MELIHGIAMDMKDVINVVKSQLAKPVRDLPYMNASDAEHRSISIHLVQYIRCIQGNIKQSPTICMYPLINDSLYTEITFQEIYAMIKDVSRTP